MTSPSLTAAAASTRRPEDVRRARAERAKPLSMLDVIKAGAAAAVKADPRPLNTSERIAAAAAKMGAFPISPPLRDIRTKEYLDAPCASPIERMGDHHTPTCQCGFKMGEHKIGGAA